MRTAPVSPATVAVCMVLLLIACGRPSAPTSPSPNPSAPTSGTLPAPDPAPSPSPSPAPVPRPRLARTRFLAFGDSLTGGVTSPAVTTMHAGVQESYPFKMLSMLRRQYPDQQFEMFNEGKPGEVIEDAVDRLPRVLRDARPEVIILLHGVNDVAFASLSQITRALGHLNELARQARLARADVIIATLPPQRPGGFRAGDPASIASYNAGVRAVARGEGALLVDLAVTFGNLSLIGMDGLHPTEAGYERMASLFLAAVVARFETPVMSSP